MSFIASPQLRCPMDQTAFEFCGASLRCAHGHSFDVAKQGYVNLLSAADKRSKDPGDSREMIVARRDFLEGGHYAPVAGQLVAMISPLLESGSLLADAGCGEGYYLQALQQAAVKRRLDVVGFDISKWAMQAAARRFSGSWLVASNRNIPLADNSVDVLMSLFGFPEYESFFRVLKPGGCLLVVNAGPNHLLELREVIYPRVRQVDSGDVPRAETAGFSLWDSASVSYLTAPLPRTDLARLLTMTPHLFRASHDGKQRAAQLDNFPVTVDVTFSLMGVP